MKIIGDTIFWYLVGKESVCFCDINEQLAISATFANLFEFSNLHHTIPDNNSLKKGLCALWNKSSDLILSSPVDYISIIDDPSCIPPNQDRHKILLEYTSQLANGQPVKPALQNAYSKYSALIFDYRQAMCKQMNDEIDKIVMANLRIGGARYIDFKKISRQLIASRIVSSTGIKSIPNHFDWSKIELLDAVLCRILKELKLMTTPFFDCDLTPIFQLGYVQPGDKVLIGDNCLRNLIIESGMKKYLLTG